MAHTVAIMQPYFISYAGYFRPFAAADLFVDPGAVDGILRNRRLWTFAYRAQYHRIGTFRRRASKHGALHR